MICEQARMSHAGFFRFSGAACAPQRVVVMITVAVDCMGGDVGPAATMPACAAFLDSHPQAHLLLVGRPDALDAYPDLVNNVRCRVVPALPRWWRWTIRLRSPCARRKTLRCAWPSSRSRTGLPQAVVSAGNTGALMAIGRYLLKTLDGIDRPAIASQMPNALGGATTVLDLGANVDCSAEHLFQFAVMGSALVAALSGHEEPTVGLLNVGEEVIKGSEVIKKAGILLRNAANTGDLNFYGNVEGNDIFKGTVDIVVCDGFVGNVALKASEGLGDDDWKLHQGRVFSHHLHENWCDLCLSGDIGI